MGSVTFSKTIADPAMETHVDLAYEVAKSNCGGLLTMARIFM